MQISASDKIGKYLTLEEFCTCTNTYKKYADKINPYPEQEKSIEAIKEIAINIIDPIIEYFGRDKFRLTYGFCSKDLKKWLAKKDPNTNLKNGRVDPSRDQHMASEINKNGKFYCSRLGAACDFIIEGASSKDVLKWIYNSKLKFDSIYYYGEDRSIHISYGPGQKKEIWGFTPSGVPNKKVVEFLKNS